MEAFLPFFVVFALLWGLQLFATAKQGQHFMREVGKLRRSGETAIGASSMSRMKRRGYVALAADETDRVTGAIELSGITVLARAKPVPELVGTPLADLAGSEDDDRRARACRMAARALLDLEYEEAPSRTRREGRRSRRGASAASGGTGGHRAVHRPERAAAAGHLPSRGARDVRGDEGRGSSATA
jgi:DNA-binding transcriptional regulator of glucitol operon